MKTRYPVVFIIFNRPDCTRVVFERIRSAEPEKLYIIGDGPRKSKVDDTDKVTETRSLVEKVDWDCEVVRIYSEDNLGCRERIYTGLNKVFETEECAIILEDDCLPDLSFFTFCSELLDYYRKETKVMHIGGDNFIGPKFSHPSSYHFSRYPHVWGWATWKRAWELMDLKLEGWPRRRKAILSEFPTLKERQYWKAILEKQYSEPESINSWGYSWAYSCWLNCGISIYPSENLVQNIGFDGTGTHYYQYETELSVPAHAIDVILHPATIKINRRADVKNFGEHFWKHQETDFERHFSNLRILIGKYRRSLMDRISHLLKF